MFRILLFCLDCLAPLYDCSVPTGPSFNSLVYARFYLHSPRISDAINFFVGPPPCASVFFRKLSCAHRHWRDGGLLPHFWPQRCTTNRHTPVPTSSNPLVVSPFPGKSPGCQPPAHFLLVTIPRFPGPPPAYSCSAPLCSRGPVLVQTCFFRFFVGQ